LVDRPGLLRWRFRQVNGPVARARAGGKLDRFTSHTVSSASADGVQHEMQIRSDKRRAGQSVLWRRATDPIDGQRKKGAHQLVGSASGACDSEAETYLARAAVSAASPAAPRASSGPRPPGSTICSLRGSAPIPVSFNATSTSTSTSVINAVKTNEDMARFKTAECDACPPSATVPQDPKPSRSHRKGNTHYTVDLRCRCAHCSFSPTRKKSSSDSACPGIFHSVCASVLASFRH
jgi:hypothetical protein